MWLMMPTDGKGCLIYFGMNLKESTSLVIFGLYFSITSQSAEWCLDWLHASKLHLISLLHDYISPNQLRKLHRLSNFTATKLNPLLSVESSNASSSNYPPQPTRKKTLSSQNPPLVGAIGVENCLQVALAWAIQPFATYGPDSIMNLRWGDWHTKRAHQPIHKLEGVGKINHIQKRRHLYGASHGQSSGWWHLARSSSRILQKVLDDDVEGGASRNAGLVVVGADGKKAGYYISARLLLKSLFNKSHRWKSTGKKWDWVTVRGWRLSCISLVTKIQRCI